MAISININGESYDVNGVDHPAEEETLKKLLATMEKYVKDDKDRQDKLLKEFKDQLGKLNKAAPGAPKYGTTDQLSSSEIQTQRRVRAEATQATQGQSQAMRKLAQDVNNTGSSLVKTINFLKSSSDTLSSGFNLAGKALGGMVGVLGGVASAMFSLGSAAIGAYMQASKFQGELAKGGATFATGVSGLNAAAMSVGSTMEELSSVMSEQRQNFALLGTSTQTGAKRFFDLAVAARHSEQNLRALGYTSAEEIAVRAEYLGLLQAMGKADMAREEMQTGAAIKNSTKMIKGFMGVAAATGTTVDALLKKAKEIAGEADFGITIDALDLTGDQAKNLAANLSMLDKMGLGALKDVVLETERFGTSIGETGTALKTAGIGPQVEQFALSMKNVKPEEFQVKAIEFAKSLPTKQANQFLARLEDFGGPAAGVVNGFNKLRGQSAESAKALQAQAAAGDKSVAAAKAMEERFNTLKGLLTDFLLKLAQSPAFMESLNNMMKLLEKYGPTALEAFFKIVIKGYEIFNDLFSESGRQKLINAVQEQFLDILIGIKKAVLRPLHMYSEDMEKAERAAFQAESVRQMAVAKRNDSSKDLQDLEEKLNKERIAYYSSLNTEERKATGERIEELKKQITNIRNANEQAVQSSSIGQEAVQTKKKSEELGTGNVALGVGAAAVGAIAFIAWNALKTKVGNMIFGTNPLARQGGLLGQGGILGGKQPGTALPGPGGAGLPGGAPTAGGVGMGALQDVSKSLTGALDWVAKAAAIAGAMYMIGKAMPTLAEGLKSMDDVEWESMAQAGTVLTSLGAGMVALGKVPLSQIAKGLVSVAAVSGAMYALGMGLGKLGESLLIFQKIEWETLGKAGVVLGVITAAIFALGAVISSGAGTLIFVAGVAGFLALAGCLYALGKAMQELPIPQLELFGKVFTDVVDRVGEVVENIFKTIPDIINSIGTSIATVVTSITDGIGNIIDKIKEYKTAGITATTDQIERLSQIPAEKLMSTALAVKALKGALDGFGGSFWENVGRGITGMFGGDQVSQIERAAAAMEKYKSSLTVLQQSASGDYILKPVDIGLYTQLQKTLDETKVQINTTFSKKTYEETFKGTVSAIDGTYNVKTSKLQETLDNTRKAIKDTFSPPYQELNALATAIKDAVDKATKAVSNLTTPTPPGKLGENEFGESADTYARNLAAYKGKYGSALGDLVYKKGFQQLSAPQQEQMMDAITAQEGGSAGDLNMRNNNPGNIVLGKIGNTKQIDAMLAKYKPFGVSQGDRANGMVYAKFPSLAQGRNAMKMRLGEIEGTAAEQVATWLGAKTKKPGFFDRLMGKTEEPIAGPGVNRLNPTDAGLTANVDISKTARRAEVGPDGKLYYAGTKDLVKDKSATITAVDKNATTDDKILNLLEQTYNLHADHYKGAERFKGFTAFTR